VSAAERIRPLFIAPFAELGGSEMMLLRIVRGLDERFDPRALILTPGPLAERLRAEGVPTGVEELPGKQGVARMPAVVRRQIRALRGEGVSFIHANQAKAAILGALLAPRLGVPLLWMKHDHVFDGLPSRALASRCDRVVCVSRAMAAQFEPRLGDRVRVAYPGVAVPPATSPLPERLHVVSVGRLDPAKGNVELLEAFALLRERGLDVRVTIAGPPDRIFPSHGDDLRDLAAGLGLADLARIGWVDDLDELYADAGVVVLASRERPGGAPSEGAPTVLMEAMAHGRPVVAPREAGIEEVVGDGGTLVDARTGRGFADALEPYLRDRALAEETGRRGRARAERLFSFERTLDTMTALYLELAGLSGAGSRRRRGRAAA
jgi:glycosyltransferase involved in cell wall biosynthesis